MMMNGALRQARRVVVLVVGSSVVAVGVLMIVLPGPAFVVIPAGLAILATEFVWARRLLDRVKQQVKQNMDGLWRSRA
jgi:tellurite resistance protein TerC